jgi:hypothetical protein
VLDKLAGMSKTFRSWKTSTVVINALHSGAVAWIEGSPPPDVDTLQLPTSRLGELVRQAYAEQTSLGWNLLFRGFWSLSWRKAQEYEYSSMTIQRSVSDNGENWAGRAQAWMFELFDLVWGLRNADEHGADPETQRLIRLAKCDRAIRRLYLQGEDLPHHERQAFRDPMEDLLAKSVSVQERWVTLTTDLLPKIKKRLAKLQKNEQHSLKEYYGAKRTPRISR